MATLLLMASIVGQPLQAPASPSDCWVNPLQVSLGELARFGEIMDRVVTHHCARQLDADAARHLHGSYVVAQHRFATLRLFGEELKLGIDVVGQPGAHGSLDSLYAVPAADLPKKWEEAIDTATYPVLLVTGAAIVTQVVIELVKRH